MNSPTDGEPPEAGGESRAARKLGDLQKNITMAEIAKAAGVSQGAISSLLNDRDYGIRVSDKTRERVFKVCREFGYIPNDLRAVVRMYPEFGDFSLLLSAQIPGGLGDAFCARVASGAIAAVPDASHPLTIAFYDEKHDYVSAPDALPQPLSSGVASKYLCFGNPNHSLFQTLTRRGFPVVSLGYDVPLPGVHSILPDYARASSLAIGHLARLGHRRIAIVSGPFGTTDAQIIELNRGVRLACEEHRVALEPQSIIYGDLSDEAGTAALDELFTHKPTPTAIFCMSDASASAVVTRATERGVAVPRDLSVIGCADDPCTRLARPRLTTVRLPAEEMGAAGVRGIDRMVTEPTLGGPGRTLLPVSLTERDSTAALRK